MCSSTPPIALPRTQPQSQIGPRICTPSWIRAARHSQATTARPHIILDSGAQHAAASAAAVMGALMPECLAEVVLESVCRRWGCAMAH